MAETNGDDLLLSEMLGEEPKEVKEEPAEDPAKESDPLLSEMLGDSPQPEMLGQDTPVPAQKTEPSVVVPQEAPAKPQPLWVTISPKRSEQLLNVLKTQSGLGEYTSRPTGPVGRALTSVFSEVTPKSWNIQKEAEIPEDYTTWFDPKTNRVDWNVLRAYGIPQSIKRGIATSAIQTMINMPSADPLDKGVTSVVKESDPVSTRMRKWAAQAADATLGNLPSSLGNIVLSDKDTFNPVDVLSADEIKQIQEAYSTKKPVDLQIGGLKYSIDPKKSVDQNLLEASSEKVGYARDLLFDATQNGLLSDATLLANLIPAIGGTKAAVSAAGAAAKGGKLARGALTAAKVAGATLNPVTAALEKTVPLAASRTLGGAALRTAGAVSEGALIQPIPESQTGREGWEKRMVIGGAMAGTVAGVGEVVAKGMDRVTRAHQTKATIESNRKVLELEKSGIPLESIAAGEIDVPITDLDRQVAQARIVARSAGITSDSDALSVAEGIYYSSKDPKVREAMDNTLLLMGTTVKREKNVLDMQKVVKESHGDSPLAGADAASIIGEIEKAIGLTPEVKSRKDFDIDDVDVVHRLPTPDADPALVHALNGDSESLRAYLQEKYPSVARVYDKVSGQTDLDYMYRRQMVKVLKNIFPDDASNLASDYIKDANATRLLGGLDHWFRTEPGDMKAAQKAGKSVANARAKLVSVGDDLAETVNKIRERFTQMAPVEAAHAETPADKIKIGQRKLAQNQLISAREASEKLHRSIVNSIESGAPVNPDVVAELKTNLSRLGLTDELEHLEDKVWVFNTIQERLAERQSALTTIIQKRNFAGQKRQKIRPLTEAEFNLDTIYSTRDGVDARMHEVFTKMLRTKNVDVQAINPVLELIPELSGHMRAGTMIPEDVMFKLVNRLDTLVQDRKSTDKSPRFVKLSGDFKDTLNLYNRQVYALSAARIAALESLEDSTKAAQVALTVSHMSESIRNPVLLEQLELVQAISATSLSRAIAGVPIPDEAKYSMVKALTGDNLINLEMFLNGEFTLPTTSHMLNVFESAKYFHKNLVDRIDELNREVLGKPLDREMFLGYFCNPNNLNDRNGAYEALLIDASRLEQFSKKWAERHERSAARKYSFQSPEYIESKITSDTALPLVIGADDLQRQVRIAETVAREMFKDDVRTLYRKTFQWGSPSFSLAYWKLNGSNGMEKLKEFFYGVDRSKGFFRTEVGDTWHQITKNERLWEEAKSILKDGSEGSFQRFYFSMIKDLEHLPPSDLDRHARIGAQLYHYFKDDRITRMTSDDWKGVWEASEMLGNLRLKVWKTTVSLLEKNNEKFAKLGIRIPAPEWRTYYVTTPKKRSALDHDTFNLSSFRDFDVSRYYGSSDDGQLHKASRIQLGASGKTDLVGAYDRPEMEFYKYMRNNVTDATTAHIRTAIEQEASLRADLGYEAAAAELRHISRDSLAPVDGGLRGAMLNVTQWVRNPFGILTRVPSLGFSLRILAGLVGHFDTPILALSNIGSLVKNIGQQTLRSAIQDVNPIKGLINAGQTVMGTVFNLKNPWSPVKNISPAMNGVCTEFMDGLVDASDLGFRQMFAAVMERAATAEGKGGKGTQRAAWAAEQYLNSIDMVTQHLKERTELAMSKSTIQIGARVYESMLQVLEKQGNAKAYEFLASRLPTKGKASLWKIVRDAEEGMAIGNPYVAAPAFLGFWHQSRVGRFGALAVPRVVAYVSPLMPQSTRFFAARTQNWYATLDTAIAAGERAKDVALRGFEGKTIGDKLRNRFLAITDQHPQWVVLPRQERLKGLSVVVYASAIAMVLDGLTTGFVPSLFEESDGAKRQVKGIHTDGLIDTALFNLKYGTGIDLGALNYIRWDDITHPEKLTQGLVGTRGSMWISPQAAENVKNLIAGIKYIQDTTGQYWVPLETRLKKAKARLDALRGSELEIKKAPEWLAAKGEYDDAKLELSEKLLIKITDHVISGVPGINLLPDYNMLGDPKIYAGYLASVGVNVDAETSPFPKIFQTLSSHPILWSYILANSDSTNATDVANWTKNYVGPMTDLFDFGHNQGLQSLESLSDYEKGLLQKQYLEEGKSEEEANILVARDSLLRDRLVEADRQLNLYSQAGLREDSTKGLREATRRRLYPEEEFAEKPEDVELEQISPESLKKQMLYRMIPRSNLKSK